MMDKTLKTRPEFAQVRAQIAQIYRRARMTNKALARSMWKQSKAINRIEWAAKQRGESV